LLGAAPIHGSRVDITGHIEPMVGRYVQFEIRSRKHRIYFEENAKGFRWCAAHAGLGCDGSWRHLARTKSSRKNSASSRRHACMQIKSARKLDRRGISTDDRALHRDGARILQGASGWKSPS